MVIWLRSAQDMSELVNSVNGVGVEGGVIKREILGQLMTLDEGFCALETAKKAWEKELKTHRERAQKEAKWAFEQAQQQGYAKGRQAAVEEWQSRTIEMLSNAQHIQSRMRWRLSELVAKAVEHIVHTTDRRALFQHAMSTLEHISDGASLLYVTVHPDEVVAAQEAFDGFSKEWSTRGQIIKVVVRAEEGLAPGSCLCESEFGMIDASLDVQLNAMRSALGRALAHGDDEIVEGLLAQVQVNSALAFIEEDNPKPSPKRLAKRSSEPLSESSSEPLPKPSPKRLAKPSSEPLPTPSDFEEVQPKPATKNSQRGRVKKSSSPEVTPLDNIPPEPTAHLDNLTPSPRKPARRKKDASFAPQSQGVSP